MTRHGTLWTTQDIADYFGMRKLWARKRIKEGVFTPVFVDGQQPWFDPIEVIAAQPTRRKVGTCA